MGIPKIIGIEQEYALQLKGGPRISAFEASCMLVDAYARSVGLRENGMVMLWDYAHETPYEDIRGRLFRKSATQQVIADADNVRINAGLPNGARFYTDHAHPEYSTPECRGARQALACDKAGEVILRKAVAAFNALCPDVELSLYKNNSDHKGHSYGCHENYLMDATAHERWLVQDTRMADRVLVPFLVTRQVFAGAGKVGSEAGPFPGCRLPGFPTRRLYRGPLRSGDDVRAAHHQYARGTPCRHPAISPPTLDPGRCQYV